MSPGAPAGQEAVIAFLGNPRAYGRPHEPVDRIRTHAAVIFLVGERAYKMKRAVRYSFLDFRTLAKRRAALEAELHLNRRTAPMLYERLVPVTRAAEGTLALAGRGRVVEWLLEMRRFNQDALLDRMAQRGALDGPTIDRLAEAIARFHERAEARPTAGGHHAMAAVIAGNAADLAPLAGPIFAPRVVADLVRRTEVELVQRRDLLERRRRGGYVRHCHGDLHLGNIVLLDGRPVLFDCLEFDETLATIDTFYDLAFVLMDLEHRGLRPLAQRLLSGYLALTEDDEGTALLPLFLACRAAIRAKVLGIQASEAEDAAVRQRDIVDAGDYLRRALAFLAPPAPRLIAVGGLSGTGKSTVAARLAPDVGPAPGAILLRSDVIRKRRFGVAPEDRLPPAAYRREVTREVYDTLARRAAVLLAAGHAAIVDAVFLDPAERRAIEAVAVRAGVRFQGFWLEAPPAILERRVAARKDDVSDATVAVLRRQLAAEPGPIAWTRLDASGGPEAVTSAARAALTPGT